MKKYIEFKRGKTYRVLVHNASLGQWIWDSRYGCEEYHRHLLAEGDIITYEGTMYSGGSDGIDVPVCSIMRDGKWIKGMFRPETWGCVLLSTLEEVTDATAN